MMRNLVLFVIVCLMILSCNSGDTQKKFGVQIDPSIVYVYYFHGQQRCKTCVAVESVAKQSVMDNFKENPKVKYVEVKTDDVGNEPLIEKYEITWNALIIAKGDKHADITNEAFALAVNSPEKLTGQIRREVNKFLE